MSWVTDVILLFSLEEDYDEEMGSLGEEAPINYINDWLEDNEYGQLFPPPFEAGNGKMLGSNIWVGAFNNLDVEEFISILKVVKWQAPENVQILVKGEESPKFTLIQLVDE